jgi:hypothetical protein
MIAKNGQNNQLPSEIKAKLDELKILKHLHQLGIQNTPDSGDSVGGVVISFNLFRDNSGQPRQAWRIRRVVRVRQW